MKLAAAKKRLISASAIVLALAFGLSPAVYADTFPYLKAFGGDAWVGGAFVGGGSCSTSKSSGYQDPANFGTNSGGILTYANGSGGGSSDEFGALSLGIMDSGGTNGGFYSDGHTASSPRSTLSFANRNSFGAVKWGGLLEGATSQTHCIPDYYSKMRGSPPSWTVGNYATSGQFKVASGTILHAGTVAAGTDLTLFVNGNAYIDGNITYAGYTEANVPKFALVAKGNIYIEPGVTQLDGVYIAQPSSGTTGVIWTCHDNTSTNSLDGTWILANCASKLTVNGALIAKQVSYTRVPAASNVAGAPANENAASNNAAEAINYTPSMVVGGPFFNPSPPTTFKIDSLVSLPPLY